MKRKSWSVKILTLCPTILFNTTNATFLNFLALDDPNATAFPGSKSYRFYALTFHTALKHVARYPYMRYKCRMSFESPATFAVAGLTVTDDISPVSYRSGSTLVDPLDSQRARTDAISLPETEGIALVGFQVERELSPSIYFEDLDFEAWLSEQLRVIHSDSEYLWLIEAAEEENMDPLNPAMSPSEHFEASIRSPNSASERGQVGLYYPCTLAWLCDEGKLLTDSPQPCLDSSLSPTEIPSGRGNGAYKSQQAAHCPGICQRNVQAGVHHPFTNHFAQIDARITPHNSPCPSLDITDNSAPMQDPIKQAEDAGIHQAVVTPDVVSERSKVADHLLISQCPAPGPNQALGGPTGSRKRTQSQVMAESNVAKSKRLRFDDDVFDLPSSPEPTQDNGSALPTATIAVSSEMVTPRSPPRW